MSERRASQCPLVILADRFDDSVTGRAAYAFAHWAVEFDRVPVRAVVWTAGDHEWRPPAGVRVHEIETINSWALPRELVRYPPTRPLGRVLRAGRVRAWQAGLGESPAVVVLDERAELPHYQPPTDRRVAGPAIVTDDLVPGLWSRLLRHRFSVPDDARLVGGWGPPTWQAGIDQFVAAAAHPGAAEDHFVWFLPRSTPMPPEPRHDATALGARDRFHWWEGPGDPPEPLVGCDVVLAVARGDDPTPGSVGGAPVIRYGSATVPATGARPEALAAAIGRAGARDLPDDAALFALVGWDGPS